jgi:hypothetical protein
LRGTEVSKEGDEISNLVPVGAAAAEIRT